MRYAFACVLFVVWLLLAPWIAKGYGEWHLPTPWIDHPIDLAFFYFLPAAAIAIAVSTYRLKRSE